MVYIGNLYYFFGAIIGSVAATWLPAWLVVLVVLIGCPIAQLLAGILKAALPNVISHEPQD